MTLETLLFLRQLTNEVNLKAGQPEFRALAARIMQAQDELDAAITSMQEVARIEPNHDRRPETSTLTK